MIQTPVLFSYAGYYGKNLPIPVHSHRGVELVYVSKGECVTEFAGGISLPAKTGTVYVTPPELVHVQKNRTEDCETYYSVMEITGGDLDVSLRTVDASGDSLLAQWFRNLYELNRNYAQEEASLLLMAVWSRLAAIERSREVRLKHHPALVRAMDYMEQHYAEAFTVSELAERAGISQSHLNALFRKETGAGAEEYLTSLRMKQARRLLLNQYYSIAEAGELAGYPDANYFSRRFRLYHGVPPGVYRKDPTVYADYTRIVGEQENSRPVSPDFCRQRPDGRCCRQHLSTFP